MKKTELKNMSMVIAEWYVIADKGHDVSLSGVNVNDSLHAVLAKG